MTATQLQAIERWRAGVARVATQEMLHLALVQNLLASIGAAPHLSRPNLPPPPGRYPAAFRLAYLPFGERALRHFMYLERPEGMQLADPAARRALRRAAPAPVGPGELAPRPQDFATIGHRYRAIEAGFRRLADRYGEARLFCGPRRAQATAAAFRWPELVAVDDLASAQAAIDTIIEQGEGAQGDWRRAHFGQFVAMLDEYLAMRRQDPTFEPARPLLPANVRPHERGPAGPLISDRTTARCADLFNVGYEVLLLLLQRYFAHTEESDAQLDTLAGVGLGIMVEVLAPLGRLLTGLPVGGAHPGRTAGPSFELFYETDYVLPHRRAAWLLLEERLQDAAAFCGCIRAEAGSLAAVLDPVAVSLERFAGLLAAGQDG